MSKSMWRRCFFLVLTGSTYGMFIWQLFWNYKILIAIGIFCILFIELNFLAIDLRNIKKRMIWGILVVIGWSISFFIPNYTWQGITAFWISLFTIWFLLPFLRSYFDNVRKITWISYFISGGYIFTLMTTILFGFAVLGMSRQFPFNCEQISWWSEKIFQTTTQHIFSSWSHKLPQETQWHTMQVSKKFSLKDNLNKRKTVVIWGLVDTQKSMNLKICETIIGQLQKMYNNPVFQIGVIFWMYLLFFWVVRLGVWVLTIIGYILFLLIKLLGVYSIEKKQQEVEEVR